jgi:Mg-chelatase subunit ChlD
MDREGPAPRQVSDQGRQGNHAQLVGSIEFVPNRFGADCRAVRFDGSSYLRVAHDPSLDLAQDFTLSTWVYLPTDNVLQGLKWLTLICKGETPGESEVSPAFRVQMTSATASVNTASTKSIGSIQQSYPIQRWFHFAAVCTDHTLFLYQDGYETARFALPDPLYPNQEPLDIGRDIPGNTEFFVGTMDDLRLFGQALSARDILALAQDQTDAKLGSACPSPSPPPPPPAVVAVPTTRSSSQPTKLPNWAKMTPRPQPAITPATPATPAVGPAPARAPKPLAESPTLPQPAPVDPSPAPEPADPYNFQGLPANNLVLLLDVSGSMNRAEKLPLLKEALLNLVPHLREADRISVITYAGGTKVLLDGVPATDMKKISRAIDRLRSNGKTRADKGLSKALQIASKHHRPGDNNRIILATDAQFDLEPLDPIVADMRQAEVKLSIFSFGLKGSQEQAALNALAASGQGNYHQILPSNVDQALLSEAKGK